MTALNTKVRTESRYKIRKGYNIEQEDSPNPENLLTFPVSMKVSMFNSVVIRLPSRGGIIYL